MKKIFNKIKKFKFTKMSIDLWIGWVTATTFYTFGRFADYVVQDDVRLYFYAVLVIINLGAWLLFSWIRRVESKDKYMGMTMKELMTLVLSGMAKSTLAEKGDTLTVSFDKKFDGKIYHVETVMRIGLMTPENSDTADALALAMQEVGKGYCTGCHMEIQPRNTCNCPLNEKREKFIK